MNYQLLLLMLFSILSHCVWAQNVGGDTTRSRIDSILGKCDQEFDVGLSENLGCSGQETPLAIKGEFKIFVNQFDNLSNAKKIMDDVSKKQIEQSAFSRMYMALATGETDRYDSRSLERVLCPTNTRNKLCSQKNLKNRVDIIQGFQRSFKNKVKRVNYEQEVVVINNSLKLIKQSCEKIKANNWKKTNNSANRMNHAIGLGGGALSSGTYDKRENLLKSELNQLKKNAFSIYNKNLVEKSQSPGILATDTLSRLRIGNTLEKCDIPKVSVAEVKSAFKEAKGHTISNINEHLGLMKDLESQSHEDKLSDIFRVNPQAIYNSILKNQDEDLAYYTCNLLRQQKRDKAIFKGIQAAGYIVLAATMFIPGVNVASTAALSALMAGSDLAELGHDYLQIDRDIHNLQNESIGNNSIDIEKLDGLVQKKDEAIKDAAIAITLEAAVPSVKLISKGRKVANKVIKKAPTNSLPVKIASKVEPRTLLTNSQEQANKYLNRRLSASELEAVEKAHRVGRSDGAYKGAYSNKQLLEKHEILREAGFTLADVKVLMRRGVVGDAAPVKIKSLDELYDSKDVVLGIKKSSNKIENTEKVKEYYKEIMQQAEAIKKKNSANAFVRKSVEGRVKEDVKWIDGFIEGEEAAGRVTKGTLKKLKAKTELAEQLVKKEAIAEEAFNKTQRQNTYNTIKNDTKKFINSNFRDDIGLLNKDYNHAAKLEAEVMIKELEASKKALTKHQSSLKDIGSDANTLDANIFLEQSLTNIDQKINSLSKRVKDIDNVNANYIKTIEEVQTSYYKPVNIKEAIREANNESELVSKQLTNNYTKKINNQLDELRKLEKRKSMGTISNQDVPGIESMDVSTEINKLEKILKEISLTRGLKTLKTELGLVKESVSTGKEIKNIRLSPTSKEFKEMSIKDIRKIDEVPDEYLKELNTAVYDDFYEGYYKNNSSDSYVETLNKMHSRYKKYSGNTSDSQSVLIAGRMRGPSSKSLIHDLGENYKQASKSIKNEMSSRGQNHVFKLKDQFPEEVKRQFHKVAEVNNVGVGKNSISKKDFINEQLREVGENSIPKYLKSKYSLTDREIKGLETEAIKGKGFEINKAYQIVQKHENRKLLDGIIHSSEDGKLAKTLDKYDLNHNEIEMVESIPKGYGTKIVEIKTSSNSKAHRVVVRPKGNQLDAYKKAINHQMDFLKKNQKSLNEEEFIDKVAEFYHTGINGHLFSRGNNSLLMTQINVMMKARGMKTIPHGSLDFRAFVQDVGDFKSTFRNELKAAPK